jgi:hypothetical protein
MMRKLGFDGGGGGSRTNQRPKIGLVTGMFVQERSRHVFSEKRD